MLLNLSDRQLPKMEKRGRKRSIRTAALKYFRKMFQLPASTRRDHRYADLRCHCVEQSDVKSTAAAVGIHRGE